MYRNRQQMVFREAKADERISARGIYIQASIHWLRKKKRVVAIIERLSSQQQINTVESERR